MFKRLFSTILAAGIAAGLLISVVQEFTTTPLILHAETYENGSAETAGFWNEKLLNKAAVLGSPLGYDDGQARFYLVHGDETHEDGEEAWGPEDGLERSLYSALSNVITGVGFAAILVACFVFSNEKLTARRGVIWGLAGFAVVTLAPVLGLPPEVPGSFAADLADRQVWWIGTSVATALALWLMVFGKKAPLQILGLLLLIAPHVIGAPQPEDMGGNPPPELAAHFASATIVVSAIFWVLLGGIAGYLWQRSDETEAA
ncbi:CbtA family protein [Rhodovibrionaceae bacterium A322]